MRVLLVVPEFPPHSLGGGGLMVQVLSNELKESGCHITVLSALYKVKGFFDKPFSTKEGQVEVIWLPLLPTPKVGFQLNTIMPFNLFSTIKLLRTFLNGDFDVVHLHGYGHFSVDLAAILSLLLRKPYIYTIHGFPKEPTRQGGILKTFYGLYSFLIGSPLIHNAARTVAVSNSLSRECTLHASPEKIEVIHNAINYQSNPKPSDLSIQKVAEKYKLQGKTIILGIGRLSVAKGFQYTIASLPVLLKKVPNAQFVVIGKDDGYGYSKELEKIAKETGVESRVSFLGGVNDEEKTALLWLAKVVVIPSIEEVFGLVALEAMYAGRPIVANRIGGLGEILIADNYSTLVDSTDIEQLALALINVLSNESIAEAALRDRTLRIKRFDPNKMAQDYLAVYEKAQRQGTVATVTSLWLKSSAQQSSLSQTRKTANGLIERVRCKLLSS